MLSGGAALGFYHVGVVKALLNNGLLPRVLSGASAGSIVCAMVGTRTDEECTRIAPGLHQECAGKAPRVTQDCPKSAPRMQQNAP